MMNMQNLDPKESVGVKLKEGICTALCLKPWFESNWYFCNITKSGYLKGLFRKKIIINQFLNSLQKQPYANVLEKVLLKILQYS